MYVWSGKRILDLLLIAVTFWLTLPTMLLVASIVGLAYRENPFFIQTRLGKHGTPFRLIKFRTMTSRRDADGQLLPDHLRITPLGRWLRQTSLDELPQLWNIFWGDMSLVGPRPLLIDYWPLYTPQQRVRHCLHPGLTGWAQINGRNTICWEEKFALDIWYVHHVSFGLDMQILLKTAWIVLRQRGIMADQQTTMPKFTGTFISHD